VLDDRSLYIKQKYRQQNEKYSPGEARPVPEWQFEHTIYELDHGKIQSAAYTLLRLSENKALNNHCELNLKP
jgi:hypothetical protein